MKHLPSPRSFSEQMMHTLRHRLRLPVTTLMMACNLAWSVPSYADVSLGGNGDTRTRVIRLSTSDGAANLRPGMTVTGLGIPAGAYITQILSGDQILISQAVVGAAFTNATLTFGEATEVNQTPGGNLTKTGTGRTVLSGQGLASGTLFIEEGVLQVGGVSYGGRTYLNDIIHNSASVVFDPTRTTTLDFANNLLNFSPYERVGSIAGGSLLGNTTTINLTGTNSSALLAVGGNNSTTIFNGTIRGNINSILVKEGTGTLTWNNNNVDSMAGTVRVESGTLAIGGIEGLNLGVRLSLSNKAGARLDLNTTNAETVTSLVGGGRGAITSFANGKLGALAGNYLSGTGGEVRLSGGQTLTLSNSVLNIVSAYGGSITGSGGLTKKGNNVLELYGNNTYTGATVIVAGETNNTDGVIRLGAYGTSSGVGTLASGGFGSLPSTTSLQLVAGSAGTARNAVFDLNGATQTVSSITTGGTSGSKTIYLRGGTLNIDTIASDVSSGYDGVFEGRGIINVLNTQGSNGWSLSGNNNTSLTGALNILGGIVSLNSGSGGTLGDTVHVTVGAAGALGVLGTDTIGSLSGSGSVAISSGRRLILSLAPAGGIANNPWSGNITGQGALELAAGASLRLTTAQSYLGGTYLKSGSALYLDYGSAAPTIIPGVLNLNGGSLFLSGQTGQTVSNVDIANGATTIAAQLNSTAVLKLEAISRAAGGVLQVRGTSVSTGATITNTAGGILGGYATYHAVDADGKPVVGWAVSQGGGNLITALATYSNAFGSGLNMDVDAANGGNPAVNHGSVGSLRFNAESPVELKIGGSNGDDATQIQTGGILVTPNVGSNNVKITGNTTSSTISGGSDLDTYRALDELIVHQHNTRGTLTIDASITGDARLTKTGQGTLILTRSNIYNGQTSIFGGVLELASIIGSGDHGSLGNGTLDIQNYGYLSFNRSDNVDYTVSNSIVGNGIIRKDNASIGRIILSGANSTYTGATQVRKGTLAIAANKALGSVDGLTSVSPSATLELINTANVLETVVLKGGRLASRSGASELAGPLILTANSTLSAPNENTPLTLSGPVRVLPGKTLSTSSSSGGGLIILANGFNQIGNVNVGADSSLQIGNNTPGSVGRGVITLANDSSVITNTNNTHLAFSAKITGSGDYYQMRNTVYLMADNNYIGKTTVGGNGSIGLLNQHADLRVGADTYTGNLGTGDVIIQSGTTGISTLRYNLLRKRVVANNIFIYPEKSSTTAYNATLVRQGIGSIDLTGIITAGSYSPGSPGIAADSQRGILQSDSGGKLTISGLIVNGETSALNISSNGGFITYKGSSDQTLWGVLSGSGAHIFKRTGDITLNAVGNFANNNNYIQRGKVIVNEVTGAGISADADFYLGRGAALQFNYNETIGSVSSNRGSQIIISDGATLTLDDGVTVGNYADILGNGPESNGVLNISTTGTAWYGLFGENHLTSDFYISATGAATVRVNKLGNIGEVGSLGMGSALHLGVADGTGEARLEYIGDGEATDRLINLSGGSNTVRIAGSGKGALILNGDITLTNPGNKILHLHGQTLGNTINGMINENGQGVLSLVVNSNAANNDMYGAGWWKLTNGSNNFSGDVTVNLGVLELAGDLGDGTDTNSVFGDLTTARLITLGANNFDGRKFDVFSGGDNQGAVGTTGATGTLLFNDTTEGTAVFGSNINFVQSFSSTTNPGGGELINNGAKVLVFNGSFTAGDSGNRNWILDGTNTGTNTINGVISDTLTTGGNTVGILKEGTGTWRLAGANTYEGVTQVARGTLELTGGLAVFDNGVINLSNAGSDGFATGTGGPETNGAVLKVLQSETIGGLQGAIGTRVDISAGQSLTVRSATQTYNGIIAGAGNFVRTNNDGSTRETSFTNKHTYTGTTSITSTGNNTGLARINVLFLANGGEASGIGASSNAASNLILDGKGAGAGLRFIGITNQSTDRLFTLGAGTGAGFLYADGLLSGNSAASVSFTNSGAIEFLTANTNQTLTLRGANISDNIFSPQINDNGTGVTSLSKTDAGMWVLTNSNNYSGVTTISNGTLAISNGSALGSGAVTIAGAGGRGLQLRGSITVNNNLTNTVSDGGLSAIGGNSVYAGNITMAGTNANFRVGVGEGASLNITGTMNGTVGTARFVKFDRGTLILSGNNTYGGATALSGGKMVLNYDTNNGGTNSSKLADGSALHFGWALTNTTGLGADDNVAGLSSIVAHAGGTLVLQGGSHSEVVASTNLYNGASRVERNGGTAVLEMKAITRTVGNGTGDYGTINFSENDIASTTTQSPSSVGSILATSVLNTVNSAYATVGQTTWAVTGTTAGATLIKGLTTYTSNSFATVVGSSTNTDITGTATANNNTFANTLRFNATGGATTSLNLAGTLGLQAGGILVTPNSTSNIFINGGTLRRSQTTTNLDTVVHHYGSGLLTINSIIANNSTGAQAFTKTGTGTVILNGANTYTGRVNIQQGVLQVGDGTVGSANARLGGGNTTSNTLNPVSMSDGATLRINVVNPSAEYLGGIITGGGLFHLAPTNTSIYTSFVDNGNFVGDILVEGGTLRVRTSTNALGSLRGITTVRGAGTLNFHGMNSTTAITERITLQDGGRITATANGAVNTSATISGAMTLDFSTASTEAFDIADSQALTISGMIYSNNGFAKTGNGVLTISANQFQNFLPGASVGVAASQANANPALLGQVIVKAGELRLGNIRALGATGIGNETIVQSGASLDMRNMATNWADDDVSSGREIIHVSGAGFNGTGALKNSNGLGIVSTIKFDNDATLGGGGYSLGSRLVLAPYDINPNTSTVAAGALLPGNYNRVEAEIYGNNRNLTIVGNSSTNDANGTGVTFRDPKFMSALNSITIKEGTFRIEKEALRSSATFENLSPANVTNGINIAYGGATFGDHSNYSLGLGPNVGARLNFYRNWNTDHSVKITMDGVTAKNNLGANYIDMATDATTPNPRTYLSGEIILLGDADRNFFHIDANSGTAGQQTVAEMGNLVGAIQAKLIINSQITGTGGFTKTGLRELRLTNDNTFTGAVNILRSADAAVPWQNNLVNINGIEYQTFGDAEAREEWGVTLSGLNGALSGTESINLQRRGLLLLDNTTRLDRTSDLAHVTGADSSIFGGYNENRINDAASINFSQGWLKIVGNPDVTHQSENLATTGGARVNVLSGTNILDIMPADGAGTSMTITIGQIQRNAGSILQINNLDSTSKFSAGGEAESVGVILNSIGNLVQVGGSQTPGTTNKSVIIGLLGGIMPHQYLSDIRQLGYNNAGASDLLNQGRNQQFITASHFMTYDAGTMLLRPLDDSEYFIPSDGLIDTLNGSAGRNINLMDPFTVVRQNTSINTLRFGPLSDSNGSGGAFNDATTLTDLVDGHALQLYVDGTLGIASGMISSAYFTTGNSNALTGITVPATLIVGGTLNFGNREAIINNQNAMIQGTTGAVVTGNLEIRSNIAGNAGLLKTGIAQVMLDGRNTYSGVTTISNGNLYIRNGRQGLGAGGNGNGVVIEGNGNLYSGTGIQIGSANAYESILVKAIQANQYALRVNDDLTNFYGNIVIDNVDLAGQTIFTPIVRLDNAASLIIHGDIYGGPTSISNDVLAIDPRILQFESAGNNSYIIRGQIGDRGGANGKATSIADVFTTRPTVAGVGTNENEVFRVNLTGGAETNYNLEQQYNAAGRLTVVAGNVLIQYDPNAANRDGSGFWTDTAISKIPNASSAASFGVNGNSLFMGFVLGTTSNATSSLFLTKPGQRFNMATWSTAGTGQKWVGGLNDSGVVSFGDATTAGDLTVSGEELRLYSMAGGTVEFNHRFVGNNGTAAPNNIGIIKVGRGTVILQNTSNTGAPTSNLEIGGGTIILDHSGSIAARLYAPTANGSAPNNAIFNGGVLHSLANLSVNSVANLATFSTTNNVLQIRNGTTEVIAEGRNTRSMTVNMGNANANSNRANLTRTEGSAINFVEAVTGNGNGIINLNFNTFSSAFAVKNRVLSWGTYGTAPRQAIDFAVATGTTGAIGAFARSPDDLVNDVSAWIDGQNIAETGASGYTGTLTSSKVLNTLLFDTVGNSTVNIANGQTLSLAGDGVAGGLLVSSNTGTANKAIVGGSIAAFSSNYTGGTTNGSAIINNVSSTANLTVGMPVSGEGIPTGAYITAINGNSITLSANATATSATVPLVTQTPDLILHQYGKGTLTIGSTIKGDSSLTIAGPSTTSPENFGTTGVVKLTGNNTYTGATYVTGSVLEISSTSALGVNPTDVTNGHLTLNGGTLRWTGGTESLGNRGVALQGGGGVIDVVSATGNLVVGTGLSGTQASVTSQEVFRGDLVKMGAGSLTFLGNNASFQGLMDVREGSLILMADNGNANAGTTTLLGTSRTWADATILRPGTNIQAFLGNGNEAGDWNIEEFFSFEGNNTFTYGGLLDITGNLSTLDQQFNLGSRRPLNLNGLLDIKGTTTFNVTSNGVLRLNNGSGYLMGSGDIVKDGLGQMQFRANVPEWTGNLVIKQGAVYAVNQADVLGTGYVSGKTITLGDAERQGSAELLLQNADNINGWIFDINHNINVVYNPAQTKRLGIDNISNGSLVSYNGDITLNDNLILYVRDTNITVGGEHAYLNFNGRFKDGATTSGNLVVQTTDTDATLTAANQSNRTDRTYGYAVLNGDNSGWTGDVTISTNVPTLGAENIPIFLNGYNQDNTAILRLGNAKALTASNDVTMNYNSILQAGGQSVTIGNLITKGGDGNFFGDAGTLSASGPTPTATVQTTVGGSTEIIENASSTPGTLTISQSTPLAFEAAWDAYFRDGTLNSQFAAPGANVLQPSAALSVTKAGSGWATLTVDNEYTGTTTVNAGVLQVGRNGLGDTGSVLALGTIVNAGGTIAGSGTVQGRLSILNGGTLKTGDFAGDAIGTLTIGGDVIFASGSSALMQLRSPTYNNPGALIASDPQYAFWKNNVPFDSFSTYQELPDLVTTAQHDMVYATGTINWGAGTKITIQGDGYTPKAGDVFRLFNGTGFFGNVNVGQVLRDGSQTTVTDPTLDLILFALGGNLLWDVSLFNSHGILLVVEADIGVATYQPPTITQEPTSDQSQTTQLAPGTLVTLSAAATGDTQAGALKYQWILDGIPVASAAARTAIYSFQANYSTKGVYTLAVTNDGGTTLSTGSVKVLVEDLPEITVDPSSVTVNPGGSHTFAVSAGGQQPLLYQWLKDGDPIEDATSSSLLLEDIAQSDEGRYSVIVSNVAGSDISAEAILTVRDPVSDLVVTVSPSDTYIGQNIRFDSSHTGDGPFTYEWTRNGITITGANQSFLVLNNAQPSAPNATDVYRLLVRSPVNTDPVFSAPISLVFKAALPAITTPPLSQTILSGSPLNLEAIVTGRPVLRYVWKKDGKVLKSAVTGNLSTSSAALTDGGSYTVEVSNTAGKAPIPPAAEVVVVDGSSRFLPIALGNLATFTANVGAGKKTVISYKWKRVTTNIGVIDPGEDEELGTEDDILGPVETDVPIPEDDERITGINTKVLKIKDTVASDNGIYRCEVTGPGGTVTGSEYDLRLYTEKPEFDPSSEFVNVSTETITFPEGLIGRDYSFVVPINREDVSKSPDKITASGLPPGLKIDPTSGLIVGKPTATKAGGYTVSVTLSNKLGKVVYKGNLNVLNLADTVTGVWVGLIDRHPTIGGNLGGRMDLTVTSKATYTGKLTLGTVIYAFKGNLNVNGNSPTGSAVIIQKGTPLPPPLLLDFTLSPTSNLITSGTLSDGNSTINFGGWRHIYSKLAPATSYTGYYTMALGVDSALLPPDPEDGTAVGNPDLPLGAGYATFTVAADGKLRMVGKMPDGETLSNSIFLGPNGELGVYQIMYRALKPGGSLYGALDIDDRPDEDQIQDPLNSNNTISGSTTWVRPAATKPNVRYFKNGFGIAGAPVSEPVELIVNGGRYDAPALDKLILDIPAPAEDAEPVNNTSLEFNYAGDIRYVYQIGSQPFQSKDPDTDMAVIKASKVIVLDAALNLSKTALKAVPKTGLVSGSFDARDFNPRFPEIKPDIVIRRVKFQGVIVREGGELIAVGYFLLPQLPTNASPGVPATTDKTSPYFSGRFEFFRNP